MLTKEIFLDRSSLNAIFVDDLVKNVSFLESLFSVNIIVRDTLLKISSGTAENTERVLSVIKELVGIYESGLAIKQKDFEIILSNFSASGNKKLNATSFYKEVIKVSPRKSVIIPRTRMQYEYIKGIKSKDIVFGIGPAGTGKTYLAMAMAISYFLAGRFNRIILTRPAMEAGESLGFLPGTLEEKIKPYLRPLYDALYDMMDFDEANRLIEDNVIEVAPLAFMRGRTLNSAFIILDEAQNTTIEQMIMFLTRIGFESKCIVTGDPTQTDLPKNKDSGLAHALNVLKKIKEISFCAFTTKDVVRNSLVEKIINAYELERKRFMTIKRN